MDKLVAYLSERTGIITISDNEFLVEDLHLTSRQLVDLAIFIKNTFKVVIELYDDITVSELKRRVLYKIESSNFNAAEYFILERNINRGRGDNIALKSESDSITYNNFWELINIDETGIFNELINSNRCLLLTDDSIYSVVVYWGLLKYKTTVGLINFQNIDSYQLDSVINIGEYDYLVISETYAETIDLQIISSLCNIIILKENSLEYSKIVNSKQKNHTIQEGGFVVYSSGSTGIPKGVLHEQIDMYYACITYGEEILGLKPNDSIYAMSNLGYAFSFCTATFQTFYAGATSLILDSKNIWKIVDNINRFKPTVIAGVPKIYSLIIELQAVSKLNDNSVRLALSSGEALSMKIWDKWYDLFKQPIIEGYGSSELLVGVISNSLQSFKKGSSGKLLNGFEATFTDKGELIFEGPSISNNILGKEFSSSKKIPTNDIFKVDQEGYYWYVGRSNFIVKYNGTWLNPQAIEKTLTENTNISECLIHTFDLELYCYFTINKDDQVTLNDIRNIFIKDFNSKIFPSKIIRVESLPRNVNGKIVRERVPNKYWIEEL